MPDTKRDKYDEVSRLIRGKAYTHSSGGDYSGESDFDLDECKDVLKSAFPPPAEDARVEYMMGDGRTRNQFINDQYESEPAPSSEKALSLEWLSERIGTETAGSIHAADGYDEECVRWRDIVALFASSPAPDMCANCASEATCIIPMKHHMKACSDHKTAPEDPKHIPDLGKMVTLLVRAKNALAGRGHMPFGEQGHEPGCSLCSAAELVEQVIFYATKPERSATT